MCLVIALRPQTPKHFRGGWSHDTDTSEPVDGNGAQNMIIVQSEYRTSDLSITGPTSLPTALTGPALNVYGRVSFMKTVNLSPLSTCTGLWRSVAQYAANHQGKPVTGGVQSWGVVKDWRARNPWFPDQGLVLCMFNVLQAVLVIYSS
jgi:hypothetical protein